MLDETTEFGQRASRRLHDQLLAWLTTVDGQGTPQPVPVWFLWDGGDIVVCVGELRLSNDPPADRVPEYVTKYAERLEANRWTRGSFAADYSVPLRMTITRIRGH